MRIHLQHSWEWHTVTPYNSGMMRFAFDSAGINYRTNTELNAGFLGCFT